jgi:hypothetical protein
VPHGGGREGFTMKGFMLFLLNALDFLAGVVISATVLFLLFVSVSNAAATSSFTEKAPLLEQWGGDWRQTDVVVPKFAGMRPLLCFRLAKKQTTAECFYVNKENGSIEQIEVVLQEKTT